MKSQTRIKSTGEVFTPLPLVREMLDKIPAESFTDASKTVLDNSCGNAQFLIEVAKRRGSLENVYGVDLMADNVCDTIARLQLWAKDGVDRWDEKGRPKLDIIDHPGHEDDHNRQYLMDHKSDPLPFRRDYGKISVRFSHFNAGGAGVFECSFDGEIWTKCYNVVCADALEYDYEFDRNVKKYQEDMLNILVSF